MNKRNDEVERMSKNGYSVSGEASKIKQRRFQPECKLLKLFVLVTLMTISRGGQWVGF